MQKKNENKFKSFVEKNKIASIIVALFLFIGIATPITYAYLQDSTPAVTNTFTPGKVATVIVETFEDNEKTDVKVKNTENVPAYIRVALVINWVDAEGNYAAEAPVLGEDYELVINDTDWFEKGGYYYHTEPVEPYDETLPLINSAKPLKKKEGYSLSIEILGSGIQSTPKDAVKEVWGQDVFELLGGGE